MNDAAPESTPPGSAAKPAPAFDVAAMLQGAGASAVADITTVKSGRSYFPVAMGGQTKLLMNLDVAGQGPFVALVIRFRESGPRYFTVLHARDPKDGTLLEKYALFLAYAAADIPAIFAKITEKASPDQPNVYAKMILEAVQAIGQRHDATVTLSMQEIEMRLEAVAQRHLAQHDAILGSMKIPDFGTKTLQVQ